MHELDAPEIPDLTVHVKDRPVLYLPDGREVIVRKPVGFANHPAVPPLNIRVIP
jgi:hypothetical protein